jgi:hypothetical protein
MLKRFLGIGQNFSVFQSYTRIHSKNNINRKQYNHLNETFTDIIYHRINATLYLHHMQEMRA